MTHAIEGRIPNCIKLLESIQLISILEKLYYPLKHKINPNWFQNDLMHQKIFQGSHFQVNFQLVCVLAMFGPWTISYVWKHFKNERLRKKEIVRPFPLLSFLIWWPTLAHNLSVLFLTRPKISNNSLFFCARWCGWSWLRISEKLTNFRPQNLHNNTHILSKLEPSRVKKYIFHQRKKYQRSFIIHRLKEYRILLPLLLSSPGPKTLCYA